MLQAPIEESSGMSDEEINALRNQLQSLSKEVSEIKALLREHLARQSGQCKRMDDRLTRVEADVHNIDVTLSGSAESPGMKGLIARTSWQINLLWAAGGVIGTGVLVALVQSFWHVFPVVSKVVTP